MNKNGGQGRFLQSRAPLRFGVRLWFSRTFVGCLFAVVCASRFAVAQTTPAWTWVGGNNSIYQPGNYGTLGTPAPGNLPPGRWNAATWTDKNGNLWLFGGQGYDAATNDVGVLFNDLWEFSPSLNEWTWMGGSSTPGAQPPGVYGTLGTPAQGNIPGSRAGAASWVDTDGNFWLFGGTGYDAADNAGGLNDLWEYSPSTNEWTWLGGSSTVGSNGGQPGVYGTLGAPAPGNIPGGRGGEVNWTDQTGNFWLFGGSGVDANGAGGDLNDLWEFDSSMREWAWMGGSSTLPQNANGWPGVYGTLGTPAQGNMPGSRASAAGWADSDGNFWLFGGGGYDENRIGTDLNDLWEYIPATNEWAWMGGSATSVGCTTYQLGLVVCAGRPGVYGTFGVPAAGNIPGGRASAASWIDGTGNLWLFGGQGYDAAGNDGNLNDFWKFDPGASDWTWLGGNTTETDCLILPEGQPFCKGRPGVYGVLSTPGPGNEPGARFGAASWVDKQGNLWLFGGYGADSTGNDMGTLNDLWEYQQSTTALPPASIPTFSPAAGTYSSNQTVTISDTTPDATIYYTTDGSAPTTNSTIYSRPIVISPPAGRFTETINAIATAGGYSPSAMGSATYALPPDFALFIAPDTLTITPGQSGQIVITVSAFDGYITTPVSFSCSGLPAGASCSFSPATVTPQAGQASTTLTVSTSATAAAGHSSYPLLPAAALAAVLCGIPWRRRQPARLLVVLLGVFGLALGLPCGCGGGSSKSQPTTATVTVTAASGSLQHSTSFTLTVD